MSETGPHENPLINNQKLRELYVAMVKARVLDEYVTGMQRKVKRGRRIASTRGQEACRVSTAIELGPGDLVSDAQVGVVMDLLSGAPIGSLLRRVASLTSGTKEPRAKLAKESGAAQLPWVDDANERLRLAMGAALAFKTLKQSNIVVAYVRSGDVSGGSWRRVLTVASRFELPIIFVVLPALAAGKVGEANLSAKARTCGVPGIPVDACDAVAIYRVAQESIGRTRGSDGPVLIECVDHQLEDEGKDRIDDPIVKMKDFMLGRKVCSEAWLDATGKAFRKRVALGQ